MNVLTTPSWFTGSDGRVHLVYELRLINSFPVPVTVQEIKVRDAKDGRVINTLAGDDLIASLTLQPLGLPPINNELAPSTVGIVWFEVTLPNPSSSRRLIQVESGRIIRILDRPALLAFVDYDGR